MLTFATWWKRLPAAAAQRRKAVADRYLLPAPRFELAAAGERMRVDRNHSVVALLAVRPARGKSSPAEIARLARWMSSRLRLTDTPGWMRDGRIGILLPDTDDAGAWKVAADLCELYPAGADRPDCEVITYPNRRRDDDRGASREPAPEPPGVLAGEAPTGHSPTTCRFDHYTTPPGPAWKRAIDIAGASAGLVVAAPLIAAAAVAVRATSPGPAFFSQEREGLGGRRFRIYKLRSMHIDAERRKHDLRRLSEQDGPAFKMKDDPRVTAVGRFLRRTSLDELPQLWNVLRGEMSLVGPRPLPVEESLACRPWHRQRLRVKPGITCTWQIYGRNVVPFDEWIRMDLDYARRQSPWLDLTLLAKTGPSMVLAKGR